MIISHLPNSLPADIIRVLRRTTVHRDFTFIASHAITHAALDHSQPLDIEREIQHSLTHKMADEFLKLPVKVEEVPALSSRIYEISGVVLTRDEFVTVLNEVYLSGMEAARLDNDLFAPGQELQLPLPGPSHADEEQNG